MTGIKKSEGKYTNFQLDSIWVFFDQAGDTVEKINYLFGKRNGYSYKYKKDPSEGLYIFQKSSLPVTEKKEQHISIFQMVKFSRLFLITTGKRKDYLKSLTGTGW